MNSHLKFIHSGFTLLEMVLVLFLIGLMASATLMLTEGVEDQAKYDETKRRITMMRHAIVGDTSRTVNGAPEISGFVADMGRLPLCLAELLTAGDSSGVNIFESPCDAAVTINSWDVDLTTGIGTGWRGPYIYVLPERNSLLAFRDGYGNSAITDEEDNKNFGWEYDLSGAQLDISSIAFDVVNPADNINANIVVSSDWEVRLPSTVEVTFKNQNLASLPIADEKLVLVIYLDGDSTYVEGNDSSNDFLSLDASSAIPSYTSKTIQFTLDSVPEITIGTRTYGIVCYNPVATVEASEYVIFDGDCNSSENPGQDKSTLRTFSVLPRQNINLNLDWIIE
ncbi:MAG: hypothetical protein COA90_02070 [Gammaproteobacteria bacterium]|nr:MAG: hypothetical protein COA90_02070 [Gammaproteobacteria bacterium]